MSTSAVTRNGKLLNCRGSHLALPAGVEVGQTLFAARRQRGLTIEDISRSTKIPITLLEAIERDDVARLPHGFFARAFVRTYAREVGLDPDDLLPSLEPTHVEEMPEHVATSSTMEEPSASKSFVFAMTLAGACAMFYSGYASHVLMGPSAGGAIPPVVRAQPITLTVLPCASIVPLPLTIEPERPRAALVRASTVIPETAPVTDVAPDSRPESIDAADKAPAVSDAVAPLPDAAPSSVTVQ